MLFFLSSHPPRDDGGDDHEYGYSNALPVRSHDCGSRNDGVRDDDDVSYLQLFFNCLFSIFRCKDTTTTLQLSCKVEVSKRLTTTCLCLFHTYHSFSGALLCCYTDGSFFQLTGGC